MAISLFSASASAIEYSCQLENNKLVSVVVEQGLTPIYRYGTLGKTEITLPANDKGRENIFVGKGMFSGGASSVYIRFQNGNYNYVLYDGEGLYYQGIVVYQGKKIISKKTCKPDSNLNLYSILNYGIPEDSYDTGIDFEIDPNSQS
ncbi:hypothetical protein MASR2M36_31490 [Providencia sp.]